MKKTTYINMFRIFAMSTILEKLFENINLVKNVH